MKKLLCLCSLLGVLVFPVVAGACLIQYSVTVTAGSDVAVFSGTGETGTDGSFQRVLVNSDQAIGGAFIENLVLKINSDPEVGVEFGVRAGSSAETISILSDVVTFSALVNPQAYASAGVTLTDRTFPANGAAITGGFDGGKVHQARYNGSTVFANLVKGFSIPGGTLTMDEEKGNQFSMITINDTLTSIESEFKFTLSALDSASGTSNFVVVPEPSSIIALVGGLGSLLAFRRRRA
jgi:hypothetical protein